MRRYAVLLLLLTGCDLYFGGGDDEPPCTDWGTGGGAAQQFRNPETGQCEGWGGGGGCYDSCGPCDYAALTIAQPDWGTCYSKCEGLDEESCLGASGCLAAYDEWTDTQDAPSTTTFKGCWETAPSGPIQGGGCWTLDAQECSRHDDCSMYYGYDSPFPANALVAPTFSRCGPEPTTQGCAAVDCGPGSHCEDQCYACDGKTGPCPAVCTPVCVPDGPGCSLIDCAPATPASRPARAWTRPRVVVAPCRPATAMRSACPMAVETRARARARSCATRCRPRARSTRPPGRENGCWTGYCIPNSACGPNDPGSCDGVTVCALPPPACPSGHRRRRAQRLLVGLLHPAERLPGRGLRDADHRERLPRAPRVHPGLRRVQLHLLPGGGCTCETLTYERCETWWL